MQKCSLTIVTDVDGEKTTFSSKAEMELTPLSARLRYMQNTDVTVLSFENQTVTVAREGDYSMRLTLKEGKTLEGKFILNGNEGVFPVQTQKVAYAITEKSLLASLHYKLLFDGGAQEMKLRLNARETYSEEK